MNLDLVQTFYPMAAPLMELAQDLKTWGAG